MAIRHWRDRGITAGQANLPYNAANARWVSIRAWSQASVNSNFLISGYYYKPFLYQKNIRTWDYGLANCNMYYPMCAAVYDGPILTDPASYNPATGLLTDVVGNHNVTVGFALSKNGPIVGARNGYYQYVLSPGQSFNTPAGTYYIREAMNASLPFMIDVLLYNNGSNNWFVLDSETGRFSGFNLTAGVLHYGDSLGNDVALGVVPVGWNHIGIYWNGTTFFSYINGTLAVSAARAAVANLALTNGFITWNYSGTYFLGHPAFYRNVNATGYGNVDYAALFKRHYEDLFFNYKVISALIDSGPITPFNAFSTTLTRDSANGIPDIIEVGTSLYQAPWYYEIQMDIETEG